MLSSCFLIFYRRPSRGANKYIFMRLACTSIGMHARLWIAGVGGVSIKGSPLMSAFLFQLSWRYASLVGMMTVGVAPT